MADKTVDLGALQKAYEEATRAKIKASRERDRAVATYTDANNAHNAAYEALKAAAALVLGGGTA